VVECILIEGAEDLLHSLLLAMLRKDEGLHKKRVLGAVVADDSETAHVIAMDATERCDLGMEVRRLDKVVVVVHVLQSAS